MNSRSYDLILLDADGTLFDFEAASEQAFHETRYAFGIDLGTEGNAALFARYRDINHALWAALERGEIGKEELKVERFRLLFAEAGLPAAAAGFSPVYLEALARGSQLLPGALDFVRALHGTSARLAIVTNGVAAVQRGRFYSSPLAALIVDLLISEELGAEKPAEAFFEEAFRRLGRAPEDRTGVVVMGDSFSADILGALGFGLDAVWYNPAGREVPPLSEGAPGGRRPRFSAAADYGAALKAICGS